MPAYTNLCKNVSSYRKLSLMTDSTIQFLRDLIAINSVNPSLVSGAAGENQIGAAIANRLRAGGLDVQVEQLPAGRSNVIGIVEGKQKGRSLMFCGHMDTVGIAGMDETRSYAWDASFHVWKSWIASFRRARRILSTGQLHCTRR